MDTIKLRRDTYNNWSSSNPILSEGEMGLIKDTSPLQFKVGNGTSSWNELALLKTAPETPASGTRWVIDYSDRMPLAGTVSVSYSISKTEYDDFKDKVWSDKGMLFRIMNVNDTESGMKLSAYYVPENIGCVSVEIGTQSVETINCTCTSILNAIQSSGSPYYFTYTHNSNVIPTIPEYGLIISRISSSVSTTEPDVTE